MKKLLTSTSLVALATFFASPALAADIYKGGSTKDAPVAGTSVGHIDWTGIYIGGQVGYGNTNHHLKATGTRDAIPGSVIPGEPAHCTAGDLTEDGKGCTSDGVAVEASPASCETGKVDIDATACVAKNSDTGKYEVIGTPTPAIPAHCEGGTTGDDGKCISGGAFVAKADDTIIDTIPQSISSAFIDGLDSSGVFGGGTIGADLQKGNFLFGVFGDYNFSGAAFKAGLSADDVSLGSVSIKDGDSWLVAARAGYLFGEEKRALLYVLGGYGQQDMTYKIGGDGSKNATFSGLVAGAGGEYAISQNVFLGIEYQHFFGGKETLFNGPADGFDNLKVTDEVDSDKVMAKLKIKLNGGLIGLGN